jgi:TnpA family transposase
VGNQGLAYKDLLYIRRRFINPDAVRQSIAAVVNRLFEARLPQFWGEDITACASDSRHFRAWDQNLLTDGMLWQTGHYDLLACRPQSRGYLLAVEDVRVL